MAVNPATTTRKLVSLPKPMVQEIRNFRFEHRIDTESEAIRRLIELGLKAVEIPNGETRAAMAELEAGKGKTFATVDGLMADLNADD